MKKLLVLGLLIFFFSSLHAQFTLSGEYRPRAEYRHGFQQLPAAGSDAAFFIDQRTRINLLYQSGLYDVKIVLQDVRVWGSQSQLVVADGQTTTIHEAWGLARFNDWMSVKIGRQEINYDDQRIFGAVGWAQQARSHDAVIVQMNPKDIKLHIGLAYNQDAAGLFGNFYSIGKSYKTFQYVWAHKDFENFGASLLFMNLGNQGGTVAANDDKTYYQQTLGGRFTYKKDALGANAAIYAQFGDMNDGVKSVKGLLYSIDLSYALSDKHTLLAGYEHISGNDEANPANPAATENKAFNPYFGTNHKFNGLMDYFYVGNHIGSVGLNDFQLGYKGKFTDKLGAGITAHLFSAAGEVLDTTGATAQTLSKSLGTEIDLTGSYKVSKELAIAFGYSQMFATDTMVDLRGGDKDETSNWAWLMITFKPTFFTTQQENKE